MNLVSLTSSAVRAIGLQGPDGVTIDALWQLVSAARTDEGVRSFLWRQLLKHPQLSFRDAEGGALRGAALQALDVAAAGAVTACASAKLRAWLCGYRDAQDGNPTLPSSKEHLAVLSEVSRAGAEGMIQFDLTKRVGIAAKNLAYSLQILVQDGVLLRESVWVESTKQSSFGVKRGGTSLQRSNILTLASLAPPPVPRPLGCFLGHGEQEATLLGKLLLVLSRAQLSLLPIARLREQIGLSGRVHHHTWTKVKARALKSGRVEEISLAPDFVPIDWTHGRRSTL